MAETLNPIPFCRCCHKNGDFKCLFSNFIYENEIENYSQMLYDTFGILFVPSIDDKIYTICDECIQKLRISTEFKNCVLACKKNACWRGHCCTLIDGGTAVTPNVKQNTSEDEDTDMINKDLEEEVKVEESGNKSDETFSECEEFTIDIDVKTEDEDSCIDKVSDEDVTIEESRKESLSESGVSVRKASDIHENKYNICNKTFKRKGNLEKHLGTHEGLKCQICPEILSSQREYDKHMEIHQGKHGNLHLHMSAVHLGIKPTPTQCEICKKIFNHKQTLRRHMSAEHLGFTFVCDICKKTFKYKDTMRKHMTVHLRTKPTQWECAICNKTFKHNGSLHHHMSSVHLGIAFECEICTKTFKYKKNLHLHMSAVHLGIKPTPTQCEICKKIFNHKQTLRRHMSAEHLGFTFVCDICKKTFKYKDTMRKHMSAVHFGSPKNSA